MSILLICATPFLGGIFALLFLAQAARGWLQGVVQPMMFSVQAKAVGRYRQGSVVGLRQTMNRLAAIVIPPVMGVIADWWGATESFVVLGVFLLLACVPILRITRRAASDRCSRRRSARADMNRRRICRELRGSDRMPDGPRYDDDFYAWTQYQAEVLRSLRTRDNRFDREHVAEEIEDLGKSERDAVREPDHPHPRAFPKARPFAGRSAALRLDGVDRRMRAGSWDDKLTPTLRRECRAKLC